MNPTLSRKLGQLCFILGFVSIIAAILVWYFSGGRGENLDPLSVAHAERFGIFIGLWAPTFFILSNRFDRYSDQVRSR